MPKLKLNDINAYYQKHGQGEPCVLIAGFSADHTVWDCIIETLSKQYEVIVFDNRGAGQTDTPQGPYSMEQLADDVMALCTALNIKKAYFIGNSMGGFILQTLCIRHPSLIQSAIISNSTLTPQVPFYYYLEAQLEMIKANAPATALIKAGCAWTFSNQYLAKPHILENLIELELNNPHPFTVTGYEGQFAAIERFNSTTWGHQIKAPTLVIGADQDLIFSETAIKAVAEKIPNAQYHGFKNCGHLPHMEYPEEFCKTVFQFTKSLKIA